MFITFEGSDGSGKTTQANLLKQYLICNNKRCIYTREPGGSNLGYKIRELMLENDISATSELFLLLCARKVHLEEVILPAVKKGVWVICDRFVDSTLCYQGILKKIGVDVICSLHNQFFNDIFPDITFLLDVDTNVSQSRIDMREKNNFYDKMNSEQFNIIRNGFLTISKKYPDRIRVINACENKQEVHKQIIDIVEPIMTSIK